jgi:hypothetical protein
VDASTSALVVAVVGVLGTLMSGLLAHRGSLRAKHVELTHLARERQEERRAQERREIREQRRASYALFNQALRQHHAALFRQYLDLRAGRTDTAAHAEVRETGDALRDVYAESQMVASDDVMTMGGGVFHLLSRIRALLAGESADRDGLEVPLDEVERRLRRASRGLYEVRQTMRADLGITQLPAERPDGHGATLDEDEP